MAATLFGSSITALIALLGLSIAWGQWYTARQKLALDLFDKRYSAYSKVSALIRKNASISDLSESDVSDFREATRECAFLFGSDVVVPLQEAAAALRAWRKLEIRYNSLRQAGRRDEAKAVWEQGMDRLQHYDLVEKKLDELVTPYLRMDQKLPRPPYEWLGMFIAWVRHRWHNRPDGTE